MPVTEGSCGDKYRQLAVTADGYSLDNPYGRVAVWTDYSGWKELARQLALTMRDHLYKLYDADPKKYNEIVEEHNQVIADYEGLPDSSILWSGGTIVENIGAAAGVVADEICMLDRYDAAIAASGKTPPPVPGGIKPEPKPKPITDIIPNAINKTTDAAIKLGAVALGAYVVINLVKKK